RLAVGTLSRTWVNATSAVVEVEHCALEILEEPICKDSLLIDIYGPSKFRSSISNVTNLKHCILEDFVLAAEVPLLHVGHPKIWIKREERKPVVQSEIFQRRLWQME